MASLALVKAIDRFDPTRGVKLTSFAVPTITGELKRHFRDSAWSLRVPRRLKDLTVQTRSVAEDLTQSLGRSPTIAEIAGRIGCSEEEVLETLGLKSAYRPLLLDSPLAGDPGAPTEHFLGELDERFDRLEEADLLRDLLHTRSDRERTIIGLYFLRGLTQSEVAEVIGVSQMQISRLLRKALDDLRREAVAS